MTCTKYELKSCALLLLLLLLLIEPLTIEEIEPHEVFK